VAFVGGAAAKAGTRFSHAGAIIEGGRGTHEGKVKRLRRAGATVVDHFDDLTGRVSFAQTILLALTGELPSAAQARLVEAILVSSIDHGATPPSCQAARIVTSTGSPLNAALAAGLLAISKHHGGAIEDRMRLLTQAVRAGREARLAPAEQARSTVAAMKAQGRRLPGFGHRYHTADPRAIRLFSLAVDLGLAGEHPALAGALEEAVALDLGRRLPLNVDGAVVALLADLGLPPELGNAFFMVARLPGLAARVWEERSRMRPMRHLDARRHVYDGPPERKL
jgi:citrate synthase